MKYNLSKKNKFGYVLYILGMVILMFILTVTAWSDIEALKLEVSLFRRESLNSLRCPIFITPKEPSAISVKIYNPKDFMARHSVTTLITRSTLSVLNEEITFLEIQPGETQIVSREITSEDKVFNRLVLVKAIVGNPYPTMDQHSVCGVMVVNTKILSGNQLTAILMTLGTLFTTIGLILYKAGQMPFKMQLNRKLFLAILVFLSIIISNNGYFFIGLIGFTIATLTIIVFLFGERELTIQD